MIRVSFKVVSVYTVDIDEHMPQQTVVALEPLNMATDNAERGLQEDVFNPAPHHLDINHGAEYACIGCG